MEAEQLYRDQRRSLFSIAYRMTGSVTEGEDIVQEAYLRLERALRAGTTVDSPPAYLVTVTTRLAIDYLRSARARREAYVGPWLPEPLVGPPGVEDLVEKVDSISLAFLVLLETLSPVERAVFVLREVFGYGYDEIAEIIGKSEANCRQIFARARRHVEAGRPRFEASPERRDALVTEFLSACERGDVDGLVEMLADDVVFSSDGGGRVPSAPQPVEGREEVVRMLARLIARVVALGRRIRPATVNGAAGALVLDPDDTVVGVVGFEVQHERFDRIWSIVNPDKLRHVGDVRPSGEGESPTSR